MGDCKSQEALKKWHHWTDTSDVLNVYKSDEMDVKIYLQYVTC